MKNAEGLALAGAKVSLIIPRMQRTLAQSEETRRKRLRSYYRISGILEVVDLLSLPHTPLRLEKWPHALLANAYARLKGFDLVYSRNLFPAWLAARLNIPVVYENHRRPDPQNRVKYTALSDLVRRPQLLGIITNSDYVREAFLKTGIAPDRILALKLGHDPRDFQPRLTKNQARSELALPVDRPLVVYAGHIDRSKGMDTLLDLAWRVPEAHFLILGGSPSQSEQLHRLAVDRRVPNTTFVPRVPPAAVVRYLFAADILINPPSSILLRYPHTITPIKLYNYLAAGRPILAGNTPDIAELLTHDLNALLCQPDDLQTAASLIHRLLHDEELARRLAREASRTASEYTWENRGRRILRFIQSLHDRR